MENLQKIAMLIDADNTQLAKLEAVIQEVNTLGRIVVKRAYGNWKKESLKRSLITFPEKMPLIWLW